MTFFKLLAINIILFAVVQPLLAADALYILPRQKFAIDHSDKAFRKVFKGIEAKSSVKSIILFIHGRGNHPAKALNLLMPEFEERYQAKVVLFNWPSTGGLFAYPSQKAVAAGQSFAKVVRQLASTIKERGHQRITVPIILFVHSMGAYVLKSFVENYDGGQMPQLFENLVLNAADVALEGHARWIDQISFAKNTYVLFNNRDLVLRTSSMKTKALRLGYRLQALDDVWQKLALNSVYIDVSLIGVNHGYHRRNHQNDNSYLIRYYHQALRGDPVDLTFGGGLDSLNHARVFVLSP